MNDACSAPTYLPVHQCSTTRDAPKDYRRLPVGDDTNIVIVGDPPNLSRRHTKIRLKHAQPSVAAQAPPTKHRSTS